MEESTGTITSVRNGGNDGVITEDGTNAALNFINPRIPAIGVGERFFFLKIIQGTPNGGEVINILKNKLP
jgi:hypothetical protein